MDELRIVGDDIYFDEFRLGSLEAVPRSKRILLYRAIKSYDREKLSKERCAGYNEGFEAGREAERESADGYLDE